MRQLGWIQSINRIPTNHLVSWTHYGKEDNLSSFLHHYFHISYRSRITELVKLETTVLSTEITTNLFHFKLTFLHINLQYDDYLYWTENDDECASTHLNEKLNKRSSKIVTCDEAAVYRVKSTGKKRA